METAAIMGLGGKPDLWHIHNHSLGKNSALTGAVAILAEEKNTYYSTLMILLRMEDHQISMY